MKLVKTDLYLLLIDEEAKIFQMDYYIDNEYNTVFKATLSSDQYKGCKKVIAYYPLSKDTQELDLPLLPNPFEKEVDCWLFSAFENDSKYKNNEPFYSKVFFDHAEMKTFSTKHSFENKSKFPNYVSNYWKYKAAQPKQFSLEDIKKAIEMAREADSIDDIVDLHIVLNYPNADNSDLRIKYIEEEIIQALSTQQLPKEFIPEYDLMNEGYNKPEDYPYQECKVLKTIVNLEGRKELMGTYKY